MSIDSAMSKNDLETFWTNRRDVNRMNFTFQSIFSPRTFNLPDKPSYITQYALGITEADIRVVVTDYNNVGKYKCICDIHKLNKTKIYRLYKRDEDTTFTEFCCSKIYKELNL